MSQIYSTSVIKQLAQQNVSRKGRAQDHRDSSSSDDEDQLPSEHGKSADSRDGVLANVMTHSQWKIKASEDDNRADFKKICSICLSNRGECKPGEQKKDDDQLIAPCLCTGYRSRQHKRCIEQWIEQTGATSCPFCNVRYEFTRSKKNFFCYIRELELQNEFLISFGVFVFSVYLFLLGLTMCYKFIFCVYECDPTTMRNFESGVKSLAQRELTDWKELEKLVDCQRSISQFEHAHSWLSVIIFCIVCVGTILLFIGIVSLCLNMIFRHYVRYLIWSKTNFRVSIQPYRLMCCT